MVKYDLKIWSGARRVVGYMVASVALASVCVSPALGASATFTTTVSGNTGAVFGAPDGIGLAIVPGQTVGLLLSTPFAHCAADGFTPINNSVSIVTLSDIGAAEGTISFGRYNGGAIDIVYSQNFEAQTAGTEIDFNFLAFVGCGAAGGCDYFQITAVGAFNGSSGVFLDGANFNGVALTQLVTASTPEPAIWLLMIVGFTGVAWQMKRRFREKRNILYGIGVADKSLEPMSINGAECPVAHAQINATDNGSVIPDDQRRAA